MEGREVSQAGKVLQLKRFAQMAGNVVDDSVDAIKVDVSGSRWHGVTTT